MAKDTVRVLVVDDDPVNLAYLRDALALAGTTATALSNPRQALARARAEPFDLVLCDLRMPQLDGEAFLRELRTGGASATARVLAMSAELSRAERTRLRKAGFHDALLKPIAAATVAVLVGGTAAAAPLAVADPDAVLDDAHAVRALGGADAMRALRALLADELPVLRASLARASDEPARRAILHKLVGGAELCGAMRLANAARDSARDASALTRLEAAFDATGAALRASAAGPGE